MPPTAPNRPADPTGPGPAPSPTGAAAAPPSPVPPAPSRAARIVRAALPAVLVAAAAVAVYANTFDVPLQFDDVPNLVDDPSVHAGELSFAQLARAAHGFPLGRWLARASLAANHAVHGLEPFGYHVVNLVFHVGAALLVLALAARLLAAVGWGDAPARRRAALATALLFAVHPVQTQAVTYVVQRMTSMGASFALAALLLWLLARGRAGGARLALAAGSAAAAFLAVSSKESYLVLPALVALVEWVAHPAPLAALRRSWRAWAAAAAVAAGLAAWAVSSVWPLILAEHERFGIPLAHRLLSQGRILLHYLSLLALPLPGRLHVDYPWVASTSLLDPPSTLPALLAVAALAAGAVALRRRAPLVTLAVGWFLVALSLEQSILPIDLVFEHRLYFAGIGPLLLASAAAVRFVRVPRAGAWAAVAPAVLLLGAGTLARNERWRDPTGLYADQEGSGPGMVRNLVSQGVALGQRGRLDEAEAVLQRAAALAPREVSPLINLGNVSLFRGRFAEAEERYRRVLALQPNHVDAWFNLGFALMRQGRTDEAIAAYERVVGMHGHHSSARVNLALLVYRRGDVARALRELDEAVRQDPGSIEALGNRALLRAEAGRRAEALEDARQAARLAPRAPFAQDTLARVALAAGSRAEAREAAAALLRLDPGNAGARAVLDATRGE